MAGCITNAKRTPEDGTNHSTSGIFIASTPFVELCALRMRCSQKRKRANRAATDGSPKSSFRLTSKILGYIRLWDWAMRDHNLCRFSGIRSCFLSAVQIAVQLPDSSRPRCTSHSACLRRRRSYQSSNRPPCAGGPLRAVRFAVCLADCETTSAMVSRQPPRWPAGALCGRMC